jgi:hypothetical protein
MSRIHKTAVLSRKDSMALVLCLQSMLPSLLVVLLLSMPVAAQDSTAASPEKPALVAPIALYPDALVAQILTGATFPDQIAVANYWLQQNKDLDLTAIRKQYHQAAEEESKREKKHKKEKK